MRKSSGSAVQGRNRSSSGAVSGLPTLRPYASSLAVRQVSTFTSLYGTRGTARRKRIILAEFTAALAATVALGTWLVIGASGLGTRILGIWLIGAGLNYAPLAAFAISLSRPGALEAELANVDTGRELSRYGVLQLWILVPLSLIAMTVQGRNPAPDQYECSMPHRDYCQGYRADNYGAKKSKCPFHFLASYFTSHPASPCQRSQRCPGLLVCLPAFRRLSRAARRRFRAGAPCAQALLPQLVDRTPYRAPRQLELLD